MTTSPESRRAILARVRAANREPADSEAAYSGIPRDYLRVGKLTAEERLAMFTERLIEYDAGVSRIASEDARSAIAGILARRGKSHLAVPRGFPLDWLPEGFSFSPGADLSPADLDRLDGLISACTLGIASTGSLVLQSAPGQGPRRLSLVPDYHLCIVLASQVVETVPEAFDRLAATAHLPTTFISGPSATADIEMTRIRGVHGPRALDVLVLD